MWTDHPFQASYGEVSSRLPVFIPGDPAHQSQASFDLVSCLGNAFDYHTRADLVTDTIETMSFEMPGSIWHSDQCKQYGAEQTRHRLLQKGFVLSMSRAGTPTDNSYKESRNIPSWCSASVFSILQLLPRSFSPWPIVGRYSGYAFCVSHETGTGGLHCAGDWSSVQAVTW